MTTPSSTPTPPGGAEASAAAHDGPGTPEAPDSRPAQGGWRDRLRGRSELGVSLLLLAVGVLVLTDTLTMETVANQRGPVGPRTVPLAVGIALLVVAVVLAVDVLRGGRGEAEAGEDVDLDEPGDWRTVALLAGIFLAAAALIDPLGFPITGALLFWGSAYALGSRNLTRDPLIAAVLSLATFAAFNTLLGVPLPGGPLMGVL
ncbi:putative tricarboxylic transport membrane protein [Streptomyces sp. WMMB 714]|uniref:tripartite tricarboxylate transporter TctB family protein n=1 Tax=Streptomyces sp. WMMB 714 TaxID=1286822 RepID=UPI0005F7A24E|nr:tripartite tricarboxylate transporter TctB family protein [Streptomyces sp. WMMB 714]SCK45501.1 putative tricarboxylic transport membrane protein [Streptomyces sp. WMMB 714]